MAKKSMVAREANRKYKIRVRNRCQYVDPNSGKVCGRPRGYLLMAAIFVLVIAWFAILFTGQYPRGLFDFIVGFGRWALRVNAYAVLLVTDRYPPFSLQ